MARYEMQTNVVRMCAIKQKYPLSYINIHYNYVYCLG